jgi:hypothetical protein
MKTILNIGLLVALVCSGITLYRVSRIEKQLELYCDWMIVKKLRSDNHENRIEKLEKIIGENCGKEEN